MPVTLEQQIQEVEREIAMRERAYPNYVLNNKMRQEAADMHLERMRAVLATLKELAGAPTVKLVR